jgi:molybdenum cofactor cytidylyltransferase
MPGAEPVAAVVLAAGSSSRMGRNKLLLAIEGETLVRRATHAALAARLDPVVVVLGHEAQQVGAELAGLPCVPVVNPSHGEGVRTSLQAGVTRAAASPAGALVVILADMPFVTAAMIGTVVDRHRATAAPLVVSRYGDVDAPPILYHRSLYAELLAMTGDRCAKQVVRRHRAEAAVVAWPELCLRDVDTPEDYLQVKAQLTSGPP